MRVQRRGKSTTSRPRAPQFSSAEQPPVPFFPVAWLELLPATGKDGGLLSRRDGRPFGGQLTGATRVLFFGWCGFSARSEDGG
jgi:hypothetical protein